MGKGDKAQRIKQIPFRASWFDSSSIGNRFDVEGLNVSGDLTCIRTGNGVGGLIRLTRPAAGDIISARLTLVGKTGTLTGNTLRLGVGSFDTDGLTALAPSTATLADQWRKLSGLSAKGSYGASADVLIDGVDFADLIPKRGETGFSEDGWVLYVELLDNDPTHWSLTNFKVDCTVQMGVL